MKKYIYHLLAATLLVFFVGCSEDDGPTVAPSVVGEWHLTTWNGETPTDFDIYMELKSDGTFNLFQKYQTSAFVCFTGNYSATENLLTGRYNDGVNWGSNYTYEVNGDKLTTTSETSTAEVSVYTKTTIPDEVRNAPVVRSEATPERRRGQTRRRSALFPSRAETTGRTARRRMEVQTYSISSPRSVLNGPTNNL